jgi:hypothetical protein
VVALVVEQVLLVFLGKDLLVETRPQAFMLVAVAAVLEVLA